MSTRKTILETLSTAKSNIINAIDILQDIYPNISHREYTIDMEYQYNYRTNPGQQVVQHLEHAISMLTAESAELLTQPSLDIDLFSKTYNDMPDAEFKLVDDETIRGIYRISGPYSLFERPEHYLHTGSFIKDPNPPMVLVTGKVVKIVGRIAAVEILISLNDRPKVCWIHFHNLAPILAAE